MKRGSIGILMAAALFYLFMYLPLATIVTSSFNQSRLGVEWKGFTFHWYRVAIGDEQVRNALKNTFLLALGSTALSTVLGTMLAYGLDRHLGKARGLLSSALLLPVAIPDIVMAASLLLFYSFLRQWTGFFNLGLGTMAAAHVTFQIPFVMLVVSSRLKGFDRSLEEAASDLGANRWQRFARVTLPLLRPGILAGALLAFTLSLDDFVISFFTSGPGSTTLPIYIYSSVKRGVSAEIHALASLLILSAMAATVGVTWLQRGRNSR